MKRRILRAAALLAAIVLIVGVCWFANSLVGNPISRALAERTAERYLVQHHPDRDFVLDRVFFSFKDVCYHVYISSPSSADSSFTLTIDLFGRLCYDTYADSVLGGWNTAHRLGREYRAAVEAVLESPAFPYAETMGYGDLEFVPRAYLDEPTTPAYAIITDDLVLDGVYDINELGAQAGKLTVYLSDDTVTTARLAEMLLEIRRVFDAAGVSFYVIDCVLEYPQPEDGPRKVGRVEVMDFLWCDIDAEGMEDRVSDANEAAEAYYADQDAEKAQ